MDEQMCIAKNRMEPNIHTKEIDSEVCWLPHLRCSIVYNINIVGQNPKYHKFVRSEQKMFTAQRAKIVHWISYVDSKTKQQ